MARRRNPDVIDAEILEPSRPIQPPTVLIVPPLQERPAASTLTIDDLAQKAVAKVMDAICKVIEGR